MPKSLFTDKPPRRRRGRRRQQQEDQQQQQSPQRQITIHQQNTNLIVCTITTTPTTTIPTRLKLLCAAIVTLLLPFTFLQSTHALQTFAAAIALPQVEQNWQTTPTISQQHNNSNNNTTINNNKQLLLTSSSSSSSAAAAASANKPLLALNHTFKSLSIIETAEVDNRIAEMQHIDAPPIFDFGMPRNITARTGQTEAVVKCRVARLNDKSVSWIRKRDLHILSVATATYTSDKRFQVTESKDSREWSLHVKAPQARDSGIYECQVNTEPKMSMAFQLNVIEISPDSKAIISGPPDLHFKVGSAIILNCVVQQPSVKDIGPIYWYRGEQMLTPLDSGNDITDSSDESDSVKVAAKDIFAADSTTHDALTNEINNFSSRIAMESQLGDTLKSRLRISNAQTTDTGNYTCQPTTARSDSVLVHVINDENPAAMQKSAAASPLHVWPTAVLLLVMVLVFCCPSFGSTAVAAIVVNVVVVISVVFNGCVILLQVIRRIAAYNTLLLSLLPRRCLVFLKAQQNIKHEMK